MSDHPVVRALRQSIVDHAGQVREAADADFRLAWQQRLTQVEQALPLAEQLVEENERLNRELLDARERSAFNATLADQRFVDRENLRAENTAMKAALESIEGSYSVSVEELQGLANAALSQLQEEGK